MVDRQLHSISIKRHYIPDNFSLTTNDIKLFTDASSIGFGAIYDNAWIQEKWPLSFIHHSIDYKELFAIWASCITSSSHWERKRIVFITDNKPITELWQSGSSPSAHLMDLIRKIYSIAVQYHFSISFKHILGYYNSVADAISRYQEKNSGYQHHLQTTYRHLYQTTYGQTDNTPPPPPPPPPNTNNTTVIRHYRHKEFTNTSFLL